MTLKGNALSSLGEYEETINCYDKALAIDPNHVDALNNTCIALGELGRYYEATKH